MHKYFLYKRIGKGRRGRRKGMDHLLNDRIIFADIWRKKIEPMKDKDKMRTTNGSLDKDDDELLVTPRKAKQRTLVNLVNHQCII